MIVNPNKKIAIVYDWIDSWGGVERVLLTLHEMFPQGDFYTSYYNLEKASWAKGITIKTSFIQKFPSFIKNNRLASILFYPIAFESFDFKEYDLVISVSSSFAKGIITRPDTVHICYLLTPTRYLWSHSDQYIKKGFQTLIASPFKNTLQKWDFIAAQRPDRVISISHTVAHRCKKYYRRDSDVIYPPFDFDYWNKIKSHITDNQIFKEILDKKYYLVVSRLESYKRVDIPIRLFNTTPDKTLVIVGTGREEHTLKQMARSNTIFIKDITDSQLGQLYSCAEALIMPQEEDFGFVALEAQFFGCPVIAYWLGGASETILEGKTGLFFSDQTVEALQSALEKYHMISYNIKLALHQDIEGPIEKFSKKNFENGFHSVLSKFTI